MMDQDATPEPLLDISQKDREIYLLKIPAQLAAHWASCDFDDELGTLVFPSDTSKVRKPSLFVELRKILFTITPF